MSSKTMKAVIFHGPQKVALEDRPVPTVEEPTDVVIKVAYTALCGRHEFTGIVTEVGADVKDFKKGDHVVSPFTLSCSKCFYCKEGHSSRCDKSRLFGSPLLDGGQAEYVLIPLADGTLVKAPEGIMDKALILMADIFPTGYFAAYNGFKELSPEEISNSTVVVIGCGPVGLCALINAQEYKPKHLIAIDGVPSRLDQAKSLGAEPWNFQSDRDGLDRRVKELTEGRGADVVLEVVGLSPALKMGFELLRPWGVISSVGLHNAEIPWTGRQAYDKNLRVQFGRCPVRSIFPQSLKVLEKNQHRLGFMADKIMPLSEAIEGYELFDKMKVQKVVFTTETAAETG